MQAGISTASLFMRKYNEEALPFLNEQGIHTAEVFLTSFSEYGEEFANILKEKQGQVKVNSIHILNTEFEPQIFNAHPRVVKDAYDWMDKVLTSAQILGAPYYTFHGVSRVKRSSRTGKNDNFPWLIECFHRLANTCEEKGVTLCLENVEWSSYNRPGFFKRIADEVPNLCGVLDVKQARISEFPYQEYIKDMGERLAYTHVSDIDENGKMCLPGKGIFDFDRFVEELKEVGFDGAWLIEVYEKDYKDEKELKISCDYLNELLYKHNCLTGSQKK